MFEEIINIIIKVVAALIALGIGWVGRWLISLIKAKLDTEEIAKLDMFVAEFVAAAEQLISKENDPDGSMRLEYVQEMLMEAGYELTDAVRALIEAKVFEINMVGDSK